VESHWDETASEKDKSPVEFTLLQLLIIPCLLCIADEMRAESSRSSFTFSYNLKACVSLEQIKKTTRFRYSRGSTSLKLEGGGGSEYN
jgi:hypothetical protein